LDPQVDADVTLDAHRDDGSRTTPDTHADDAVEIDPGRPSSESGTRCYVELTDLTTNAQIVFDNCTASAVSNERTSHLFLIFPFLPGVASRMYTSLVLGMTPIAPGEYVSAQAGAIETTLRDGRVLSAGDIKVDGSFRLRVAEATSTPIAPTVYLINGVLESILVDAANGASKFQLRAVLGRGS
jgi:hypothetical protein